MDSSGIIIVTGGAAGIGRAIAEKFLTAGWSAVVAEKQPDVLEKFLGETRHFGSRLVGMEADVTNTASVDAVFERCRASFGPPTCLVNNAGKGNAKEALQTSDDDLELHIAVNLTSVFKMCRKAGQEMAAGSAIINIASVVGLVGFPSQSPYSAAKAGVIGLTRQLAAEFGPRGIRVNAIAPGAVVTDATRERLETNKWLYHAMIETSPLGRPGEPRDIAEAAFFLGSPAARHVNAVILPVDGGWSGTRFFPSL